MRKGGGRKDWPTSKTRRKNNGARLLADARVMQGRNLIHLFVVRLFGKYFIKLSYSPLRLGVTGFNAVPMKERTRDINTIISKERTILGEKESALMKHCSTHLVIRRERRPSEYRNRFLRSEPMNLISM